MGKPHCTGLPFLAAATSPVDAARGLCVKRSQTRWGRGPSLPQRGSGSRGLSDVLEPVCSLSDVLLKESQWTQMFFGEGQAALSFSHLNKDDEGLYTLRIVSRGGVSDHSAYLFVRGR